MLIHDIEKFDKYLFLKINTQWTNGFLDSVIPWWRDQNTWIPLYLFLIVFIFINFGWKAWKWLLFVLVTIAISDQICSHLLKELIGRVRPCNDPVMRLQERFLIDYRPQSGSMPSSHACNHFAIGIYFFFSLRKYIGKWAWFFIFWASTISYGQVYVGVHYPTDIICGAALGFSIGWLVYFFSKKYFGANDELLGSPLTPGLA